MSSGLYCVLEGVEGAGKSSAITAVGERLRRLRPELAVRLTRHPGATPLGAHLRKLVKYPHEIDPAIRMDPLSSQLLMVVDNSCFVNTILRPALQEGVVVLADRSNFISSIAYGVADGLDYAAIDRMFRVAQPPKADRLYILQLSCEEGLRRMQAQQGGDGVGPDRWEQKGAEFHQQVQYVYDHLITGPPELLMVVEHSVGLENIRYVDASLPPEQVAAAITADLLSLLAEREL